MHVVEFGGELELLIDGWLGDAQSLSNLTLAHAGGGHRPQCQHAPHPGDVFVASGVAVRGQWGHKTILSGRGGERGLCWKSPRFSRWASWAALSDALTARSEVTSICGQGANDVLRRAKIRHCPGPGAATVGARQRAVVVLAEIVPDALRAVWHAAVG